MSGRGRVRSKKMAERQPSLEHNRGRNARKKSCEMCGYLGIVGEEGICKHCELEKRDVKNTCRNCKKRVSKGEEAVQCDECSFWFHMACENIGKNLARALVEDEEMIWHCRVCKPQIKKSLAEAKKILQENESMKTELEEVKRENSETKEQVKKFEIVLNRKDEKSSTDKHRELWEELEKIKEKLTKTEKKVDDLTGRWENFRVEFEEKMTEKMEELFDEWTDKEARKNNIVIFNMAEGTDGDQQDHDKAACLDVIENELGIERAEIVGTIRLGKPEDRGSRPRKPRPLPVKLSQADKKWEIVKNGKKLKEARKDEYKKMYIVPDLTLKEREKDKELRTSLKEKRDKGERDWAIRKGCLIRVKGNFFH